VFDAAFDDFADKPFFLQGSKDVVGGFAFYCCFVGDVACFGEAKFEGGKVHCCFLFGEAKLPKDRDRVHRGA